METDKRLKIGIDVRELVAGKMTGIGRYLLNFLEWAAETKPEAEFFLYANQDTRLPREAEGFTLRVLPERITFYWDQILLPRQLKRDGIHVFFSPYYKAPLFSPCPACVTIHDLLFLELYNHTPRERVKNILFVALARMISRKAARIITDSRYSREDIVRRLNVERKKIEVVYINTSGDLYPEGKEESKAGRGHEIGEKYILYIGNFKPHKNVKALARAFHEFQAGAEFQDYQLVLGGKKDADALELEREIGKLGLKEKARFTGHLEQEEMRAVYSGARVFVFPSLYEGYGLPVLEAMACGVPVVCANRTSLPEIAGDAALLVDPESPEALAEAMRTAAGDEEKRKVLIERGLEKVRELNRTPCAARLFDILRSTVDFP